MAGGVAGRLACRLKNSVRTGEVDGEWTAKCDAERAVGRSVDERPLDRATRFGRSGRWDRLDGRAASFLQLFSFSAFTKR